MKCYCTLDKVQFDLFGGGNDHFSDPLKVQEYPAGRRESFQNVKIPKIQAYGPHLRPGNSISRLHGGVGGIFRHLPVKNEAARLFSGGMRTPTQRVSTFGPHGRMRGPAVKGRLGGACEGSPGWGRGGFPHSPLPSSLPVPPGV